MPLPSALSEHLDKMYEQMDNWIPISHHAAGRHNNKVMSQTQTGFTEAYAQTVSADCELDL